MAQVMELEMSRTTDCLKCNFPREEPKGARVCKKCGRLESRPKGSAHRGDMIVGQTDVQAVDMGWLSPALDPLAAFLPPLVVEPVPEPPAYVEAVTSAVEAVEKALLVKEVAEAKIEVLMSTRALAEYPLDPPTVAGAAILPVADASPIPSVTTVESEKPQGHSPLGGSGAKRWMNCTGSTALIQQLGVIDDDSEYSREGTQAHELAALCLETGIDAADAFLPESQHTFPLVKPDDAAYVQQYIDYVRSRPGRKRFEVPFHRPELHELYRGMVDAECVPVAGVQGHVLEIIDYKHGAGVYVPVVRNEQAMYYAAGVIMEDEDFYPDEGWVRLTIVQPRLTWMDEPIRSWDTKVGEIKRWLREECLPAMNVRTQDMVLSLGEWCQFCPAKLVCRAMTEVYRQFSGANPEPLAMSDEALGTEFSLTPFARMRIKAVEQEVFRRMMDGKTVPLAQLERGKADRVWKENVTVSGSDGQTAEVNLYEAAVTRFGQAAYETKFKSPAQIEKLPDGKAFVAEWAYAPEASLRAALATSGKPAVQLPSPEERYGDATQYLVANKVA